MVSKPSFCPFSHTTPFSVILFNLPLLFSTPLFLASIKGGTMTIFPKLYCLALNGLPSFWAWYFAVATLKSTRPSTSSGRNVGGCKVDQEISATFDISAISSGRWEDRREGKEGVRMG